jgi:hypothetical protein
MLMLAITPSSASAPTTVRRSHRQRRCRSPQDLADGPPPARGAAVGPGQAGVDAGLVEEDEPARVDPGQLGAPCRARPGDILPVLLGGPERLFFRTRPSALRARHTAEGLRRTPARSRSRSAYSAKVASFRSATNPASTSPAPPTGTRLRAGVFGPRRPSVRAARSQRESVRSPTRKRPAISAWLPSPAS